MARDLDGSLGPLRRFLERDLEIVAEVTATLRTAAAASAAEQVAEPEDVAQPAKQILETLEHGGIEASARRGADAGMTEPVVQAALLGVGEDRVRFRRFLEFLLGRVVAWIAIGMVLHRLLAVGALDLGVAGTARHAEDLVVIPLAHGLATFAIAGRSNRSPIM